MTTHRTITLTDRPPVRIDDDAWPCIAKAGWYEGEIECQANRSGWLRVRRHADGRTIVYGAYDTAWRGEACIRAGELLTIDCDVVAAIRRVGIDVAAEESCIRACIGDLPAEEI
jgi:hypothetical protein